MKAGDLALAAALAA
ncbi:unnamed protein product, partial [Diplocarpon coronariae]